MRRTARAAAPRCCDRGIGCARVARCHARSYAQRRVVRRDPFAGVPDAVGWILTTAHPAVSPCRDEVAQEAVRRVQYGRSPRPVPDRARQDSSPAADCGPSPFRRPSATITMLASNARSALIPGQLEFDCPAGKTFEGAQGSFGGDAEVAHGTRLAAGLADDGHAVEPLQLDFGSAQTRRVSARSGNL